MFGKRKNHVEPPDRPFSHDPDCRILKVDPDVVIPWSRHESVVGSGSASATPTTGRNPLPAASGLIRTIGAR